ncbi:hypothetical protein [Corynebacterium xerosis]|uniref:hypothetical protein n=1 Tax=Corynebacterium xerosis TaxID=1725 RepID=UPI0015E0F707|nr:hypothetical protein [Corynebacterium xerosis]
MSEFTVESRIVPDWDTDEHDLLTALGFIKCRWDHTKLPLDDVIGYVPFVRVLPTGADQ